MHLLSTYYCVRKSVWVARETQDFASLLGVHAVIASGILNECIGMGRTGDARFCVSTREICICWQSIITCRNKSYRIPPFTIQPSTCLEQEIQNPSGVKALKERRAVNKTRKPHWRLFHSPVTKPPPPDGRMPLAYREQLFSVHGHAGRTTRMDSGASGYGRELCATMYISHYQRITA